MSRLTARIAENLAEVRRRIAAAAERRGREAAEITLIAVTKYVGLDETRALVEAGCLDLGESRPQQLWEKAAALGTPQVRWHLIGHLQRNKVARTVPLVSLIHSADSPRLIAAIDEAAAALGRRVPILLEVNIADEPAKHGFAVGAIEPFLEELAAFRHVEVRGLMGMARLEGGLDAARRDFAALFEYRHRLRACCPEGISLDELSMGMSGDYEAAIEAGATMVRIGSALFEGVEP